jgi:biotin carboxylase
MKIYKINILILFILSIFVMACSEDCEYNSIITEELPEAKVGESYSYKIELSTTCTPANRKVELLSGVLPDGITLEADGEITGTAKIAGTYPITVKARVCFGSSGFEYTDCSEKTKAFEFKVIE